MRDWIGTGQSNSTAFLFEVRIPSQERKEEKNPEKNWELKALFLYISVYRAGVSRKAKAGLLF